ncbi:MAG: hypothetical protein IJW37_01960 [Lachnospiraceae bacterium]|nr:hypothetical protein [Lachnospiraceae bacterium]
MNRRNRTKALLLGAALLFAAGCKESETEVTPSPGANATPQITGEGTTVAPVGNAEKEAKMLQDMVNARTLPALEARIPNVENVMVEMLASVGTYGESAQFAAVNADTVTGELVSEGLFRYDANGTIAPNIAKSYEVNSNFTEYTIYLREGMRWSDGVPFTSDDCVFFYDHMCVPQVFGEALWSCFIADTSAGYGAKATVTKLDNYSFRVKFMESKPEFLAELIEQGGILFAPEHYFVNLLPEYMGEDAALAKAKDMGYESAEAMLKATVLRAWNVVGIPTLNPYCISEEEGKDDVTGDYYEFVRNPYYWKVDADGKQLPYLDKLEFTRVSGIDQGLLLTTEGYLTVNGLSAEQVAEAQAAEERGDYHLVVWDNFTYWAVNNRLKNFPETSPQEKTVRGLGAAHAEGWYFE